MPARVVLSPAAHVVDQLIDVLRGRGYTVIGPRRRDGAIVLDEVGHVGDLPVGWTDHQTNATYRLEHTGDARVFGASNGPHSPRRHLAPPRRPLWAATKTDEAFEVEVDVRPARPVAFIGLRACDIAAIAVQRRVLSEGPYPDHAFTAARSASFVVGVNCDHAVETCFCASMGTGPEITVGHDLAMTEVLAGDIHELIVEAGSDRGSAVLSELCNRVHCREATSSDQARVRDAVAAASQQSRAVDPRAVREVLIHNLEHPRWDDVASRCLSCANCTLVCPTCFCTAVEDVNSLDGRSAERVQRWDSCFTLGHSELHGAGSVRGDTRARYRQWLTHKFSTWWDQFGESGCVGCGRCITWCPAGIDVTEEVAAIGGSNS